MINSLTGIKMTQEKAPSLNNVIKFNKDINDESFDNILESIDIAIKGRMDLSSDLRDMISDNVIGLLGYFGINAREISKLDKDVTNLEMAIESLVYRYYNLEHPMHETIDEMFAPINEDDKE